MNYFKKFRGQGCELAQAMPFTNILFAWLGGFIAVAILGYLTQTYDNLLVMGSFGATCVLLFGFPLSPFAQPRNVILGHFISTFIGLLFLHLLGNEWWSMALALATAMGIMLITNTVHPPAGSNPIIVFLLNAQWAFLITPTLFGAVILVVVALFYLNIKKSLTYPLYWY